ncbi:CHST8-like protein, partial [Mya arenaria]
AKEQQEPNRTEQVVLQNPKPHKPDGFTLAKHVRDQCGPTADKYPAEANEQFWIGRMHVIPAQKSMYCPVEKVGTTFWRRFIYQVLHPRKYRHPFQVPIGTALMADYPKPQKGATRKDISDLFKFMFVRNPYHRVLSAFVDKVFVPNPLFWRRFGKPSIQMFRVNDSRECFHDPTFAEFVQFVTWSEKNKKMIDPHFLMSTEMCLPCASNFTFIGKMESFKDDSLVIFERFNLSSLATSMEKQMKTYAAEDAISDSISSPFAWKKSIVSCMAWYDALHRIWRKLQLRGLIEFDIKMPLNEKQAEKVTRAEMIKLANEAWKKSNPMKLKEQKTIAFNQFYMSVPLRALNELKDVFARDFYLFDYDKEPPEIFDRKREYISVDYALK